MNGEMTGVKETLIEMIKALPDPVAERLEAVMREKIQDLIDEWKWDLLFAEASRKGWFDRMAQEVEEAITKGEVSDLVELLE